VHDEVVHVHDVLKAMESTVVGLAISPVTSRVDDVMYMTVKR